LKAKGSASAHQARRVRDTFTWKNNLIPNKDVALIYTTSGILAARR
jgi:hypothetical protein